MTLKLKTADFRIRTRAQSFEHPTQLAARIFAAGRDLLAREIDGTTFRLIGIGMSALCDASAADLTDLLDHRIAEAEHAIDKLREKFGDDAIIKGLALERRTNRMARSTAACRLGEADMDDNRKRRRRMISRPASNW